MSAIEQTPNAAPPTWEASAQLYQDVETALANTPGGANVNLEGILRSRYPRIPSDIIQNAADDVSRMLQERGWRVTFDGSVLYVRRNENDANHIYAKTMSRIRTFKFLAILALSVVRWWDVLTSFFAFPGVENCASYNDTACIAGPMSSMLISLLPLVLIISVLAAVARAIIPAVKVIGQFEDEE